MITVSIHQPSYLVWPPLLEKMARADLFIYLDDAEYSKNSEINRNRVLSRQGPLWLTIPVNATSGIAIRDARIADRHWKSKHWKTIANCYAKAPFFAAEAPALEELYRSAGQSLHDVNLLDINLTFAEWLRERLGVTTPTVLASSLGVQSKSSQRILDLCRAVGAERYLSGPSGLGYLDLESFERAGIEVLVQNYQHRPYPQQFRLPEFIPRLSAVDMVFSLGRVCLPEILARGEWVAAEVGATR